MTAATILRPGVIEVLFAQPADTDGNPAGPVLWIAPETGHAGKLFLEDRASDEAVSANLHRSFPAPYFAIRDRIRERGLIPHPIMHDAINKRLATLEV
jgi:hypothetical protein